MIPLAVLAVSFAVFLLIGLAGVRYLADYHHALRPALAVMFFLTASAHWRAKRSDLIRMVPPMFRRPDIWVTATGVLEILGAIGLLIPATARVAAFGLALLLIAMFPANIHAARLHLKIGGRPVPALGARTVIQIVFLACVILAAFH